MLSSLFVRRRLPRAVRVLAGVLKSQRLHNIRVEGFANYLEGRLNYEVDVVCRLRERAVAAECDVAYLLRELGRSE